MFKHILVAVDGSAYAENAIPYAVELAKDFKSDVFVLHVHEREPGRAGAFPMESFEEADRLVAETVKTFRDAGVAQVKGEVQHAVAGQAAKYIVDTAKQQGSDLIVMGSRGLSDIQGLMLGSVTHKVLQLSEIPVFVARGPKPVEERQLVGTAQEAAAR